MLRALTAFVSAALAAGLFVVTSPPPPAGAHDTITFHGGGWGHAAGMSQYGAFGMAKLGGQDYRAILAHYYVDTAPASIENVANPGRLWVNLEQDITTLTLRSVAIRSSGTATNVRHGTATLVIRPGDTLVVERTGGTPGSPLCEVSSSRGTHSSGACHLDLEWDGDEQRPTTRLVVETVDRPNDRKGPVTCTMPDWNAIPTRNVPCSYGRGELHVRPDNDTTSFHLVAELDPDDYVLGISEMPYGWGRQGGIEALKAQAVASRSYGVSRAVIRGEPGERTWCWCHLYDSTIDQRYVGWGHSGRGQEEWIRAVGATAGEVLIPSVQRHRARPVPLQAHYGSSSYGRTEPSQLAFGPTSTHLQSVDDQWAVDPRLGNRFATWSKGYSPRGLAAALGWAEGRRVARIEVVSCSPSGAASQLRFFDDDGRSQVFPSRDLRRRLRLRSPQITAVEAPQPVAWTCSSASSGDVPPAAAPPQAALSVVGHIVDDGVRGDSIGNFDRVAQCGETIELYVVLGNAAVTSVPDVSAVLSTADPYLRVKYNTTSRYPAIAGGGTAENRDDWDLTIAETVPPGHRARLSLVATTGGRSQRFEVDLPIECESGAVAVAEVTVDDGVRGDSIGNFDRVAQCGETIELYVTLRNDAAATGRGLVGTLTVTDSAIRLLYNTRSRFSDIAPGGTAENLHDWDLRISPNTPDGHTARLGLDVRAADGTRWQLTVPVPIRCP